MVGIGDGEVGIEGLEPEGATADAHGDVKEEGGAVAGGERVVQGGASFFDFDAEDGGKGFEAGKLNAFDGLGGAMEGELNGHVGGGGIIEAAGDETEAPGRAGAVVNDECGRGRVDLVFDVWGGEAARAAGLLLAVVFEFFGGGGAAILFDESPAVEIEAGGVVALDEAFPVGGGVLGKGPAPTALGAEGGERGGEIGGEGRLGGRFGVDRGGVEELTEGEGDEET